MAVDDDSFFSRWSRRKQQVRTGQPLPPEPVPAPPPAPLPVLAAAPEAAPVEPPPPAPEAPPAPTLDDVARLTPEADFSPFVAKAVPSEVRNAAVKKLFADPHFNVMDGLDIYIDDYSKPSPLSKLELAKMVGAQFLKLVDDPEAKTPTGAEPAAPAQAAAHAEPLPGGEPEAAAAELPPPHDDHADLQLQPDHAPERERSGPGAG